MKNFYENTGRETGVLKLKVEYIIWGDIIIIEVETKGERIKRKCVVNL